MKSPQTAIMVESLYCGHINFAIVFDDSLSRVILSHLQTPRTCYHVKVGE